MKLGHVALSVSNIEKSAKFYCRWFGLKRSQTFRYPGMTIVLLRGAVTLELFQFAKRKPLPKYRRTLDSDLRTLGVKHFCFEITDVDAMLRKLQKARVKPATDVRTMDNGLRYFFIKDPDGNLVELMEVNHGL